MAPSTPLNTIFGKKKQEKKIKRESSSACLPLYFCRKLLAALARSIGRGRQTEALLFLLLSHTLHFSLLLLQAKPLQIHAQSSPKVPWELSVPDSFP